MNLINAPLLAKARGIQLSERRLHGSDSRAEVLLSTDEYFRLWASIEELSGDSAIGLRIGAAFSVEALRGTGEDAFLHALAKTRSARTIRTSGLG